MYTNNCTTRRVWKKLENQDVRGGRSRADAKHDCKQMRKMFRYGGVVLMDCNGKAVWYKGKDDINQAWVGVEKYCEELLEGVRSGDVGVGV